MEARILGLLVTMLAKVLTPELLRDMADTMLDFVEDKVAGTKSQVDDRLVLPVCKMIRKTFDIPDND